MNNSILDGCDFTGANMKDIELGMYPSMNGGQGSVNSVSISGDGQYVCSAGKDGRIIIWDLNMMKRNNKMKDG